MTVKELIAKLQEVENQDIDVKFCDNDCDITYSIEDIFEYTQHGNRHVELS